MAMDVDMERALLDLSNLGFEGSDVYLAEIIPAVEMAWCDGVIQPEERATLEAYCEDLTGRLNREAQAPFFTRGRALFLLDLLSVRRLLPAQRQGALRALKTWSGEGPCGATMRRRIVAWAEAVAVVTGHPAWDTRELFWLQTMRRTFELVP